MISGINTKKINARIINGNELLTIILACPSLVRSTSNHHNGTATTHIKTVDVIKYTYILPEQAK
jgi:hypothetical protein